jgi:hypothetical protein
LPARAAPSNIVIGEGIGSDIAQPGDIAIDAPAKPKPRSEELKGYLSTLSEFAYVEDMARRVDARWHPQTTISFVALTCGTFWLAVTALFFYIL